MESNSLSVSVLLSKHRSALNSLDHFLTTTGNNSKDTPTSKAKNPRKRSLQQSTRSFKPFKVTAAQYYARNLNKTVVGKEDSVKAGSTQGWHSKRMISKSVIGERETLQSCQRSLKASRRLFDESALLLDQTKDMIGRIEVPIANCFDLFATATMNLSRVPDLEHSLFIYQTNRFPQGLVGPITIHVHRTEQANIQLVLWAHHSIHSSVVKALNLRQHPDLSASPFAFHPAEKWPWGKISICGEEADQLIRRACGQEFTNSFLVQFLKCSNPDNVWRHGYVLNLEITDPRYISHSYKLSLQPTTCEEDSRQARLAWPQMVSCPLWSEITLGEIQRTFRPDIDINHDIQRERDLKWKETIGALQDRPSKPSSSSGAPTSPSKIPVMLIRYRKGGSSLGGWSLIAPRAYTHTLWMHLTHLGGIAVGRDEMDYIHRSHAFHDHLEEVQRNEMKKPPGKRLQWDFARPLTILSTSVDEEVDVNDAGEDVPQNEDDSVVSKETVSPSFVVIRSKSYLEPFLPPAPEQEGGEAWWRAIETHEDWQKSKEEFLSEHSERMNPLPTMPWTTFVHAVIEPEGRGQPHTFALLFRPTAEDLKNFVRCKLLRKLKLKTVPLPPFGKRSGGGDDIHLETHGTKEWLGEEIRRGAQVVNREVLGVITSGDDENGSHDLTAIGVCHAGKLHEMMRSHMMRLGHPLSHLMIMFQNPGSSWIRPALFKISS